MNNSELNIIGKIAHFFTIRRPLSFLFLLVIVTFGIIAFFITPKQYNPEIVRPAFVISTEYVGATTEQAFDRVLLEMVEKVSTVPGVDEILSHIRDGSTINTTVIFDVGYDATKAKVDLLSQIEQHSYLARGFIKQPTIQEINPETIPILQIAFRSNSLSISEVRELVTVLGQELHKNSSVSEVTITGGYEPELVVDVDVTLLNASGITLNEVTDTLRVSQIRSVHSGPEYAQYRIPTIVEGRADSPEKIAALSITSDVTVGDVARVYTGSSGERSYVLNAEEHTTPQEIIMMGVAKVEGSNAPAVAETVRKTIDAKLLDAPYNQLTATVVGDDGAMAQAEIFGLTKNLVTSIVIVAIVLLLFLSFRAALVVLIAIPVTLLVVLALGYLFDQTINRITLFALILSLGLLVDSAIVVTENIYARLFQTNNETPSHEREKRIAVAVNEVGIGLLLSALTSVIVFLPMAHITGMMGPYMGPIAFFVPAAIIVSLLVAILITPFVASLILYPEAKPWRISQMVKGAMTRITKRYTQALRYILTSRIRQRFLLRGALLLFLFTLLLPMTGLVHFQMLPKADRDQFYVYLDLERNVSGEATREAAEILSKTILSHPQIISTQIFVATPPIIDFNGMFKGAQDRIDTNQATIRVNLTAARDRSIDSSTIVSEVRSQVANTHPELLSSLRFNEEPPGPPVAATFVAKIKHPDPAVRNKIAQLLSNRLPEISGTTDIYSSDEEPVLGRIFTIDHTAAAAAGIPTNTVSTYIQHSLSPQFIVEYLGSNSTQFSPLTLTLSDSHGQKNTVPDIITIPGHTSQTPLLSLVREEAYIKPSSLYAESVTPVTYVTAEVADRSIVYVMIELIHNLATNNLDEYEVTNWSLLQLTLTGTDGTTIDISWGGEWEMTLENFRDLGIAMSVALLLVFAVLVGQYNRFSTPAYILVTVPLGLIGILWGFLVLDQVFGILLTATALIGFIALIGIVVNNAIIYLEYVEQAKRQGYDFTEALIAAGAARLRPIFLTSLTTILASLTIASDPVWSGLAWAIVFGLSLSTFLTLIIYPTLLAYFVAPKLRSDSA